MTRYVYLDARYEQVRQNGHVRDAAVLIAKGVGDDGKRRILGVSVALSEHEAHWRTFLQRLVARGLRGVELIISDDHGGLAAARKAVFGGVPWQRCQFHLQVNAGAYVPRQDLRAVVASELRAVFTTPDRTEAERLLAQMVQRYATSAPHLATWLETNVGAGLTVFAFPTAERRLLRTTNGLQRVNCSSRLSSGHNPG